MLGRIIFSILAAVSFCPSVWAFPEMVRHNYPNCIACHVSPTGGGLLTQYGRELSRDVLSAAGGENESAFAYGAIKTPEWVTAGGDVSYLGLYRDTPTFTQGKTFLMQADLEAALAYKKALLVGTVGYKDIANGEPTRNHFISREHYVSYRPTDEVSVRGGRFDPAYGIHTADHAITIKRSLGWDQGSESYNLEAAWIGSRLNVYGTGIIGRPDAPELNRERGAAFQSSVSIADSYKVGASYFYGSNRLGNRHVAGPFGILGFSPHLFLLTELDFQWARQRGLVDYQRLDYEFFQGFHVYLTQELSRLDFSNPDTRQKTWGLGVQFFPRPHLEVDAAWQIQTTATTQGYTDLGFLMLHFYL